MKPITDKVNPANSEAVQAALAYSMKPTLSRFSAVNPAAWEILNNYGDRETEPIPYIAAKILGTEVTRLQAALAAANKRIEELENILRGDELCDKFKYADCISLVELAIALHVDLMRTSASKNETIDQLTQRRLEANKRASKAEQERDTLCSVLKEAQAVFIAYEIDAEGEPPFHHRQLMEKIAALATPGDTLNPQPSADRDRSKEDYAIGRHFIEQWNTPLPPTKEHLLPTDTLCPVCGVGYIMFSGCCDHCDSKPTATPGDAAEEEK